MAGAGVAAGVGDGATVWTVADVVTGKVADVAVAVGAVTAVGSVTGVRLGFTD